MDDSPILLVYKMEEPSSDKTWYLDAGCSNQMCGKKEFIDLDEKVNNVTKFGDDQKIVVKGKGNILIHACNRDLKVHLEGG